MKTIPIAAHYALSTTTLCRCLKITRRDLQVFGFTSLDENVTVDGVTYVPGIDASAFVSTNNFAVDNMEATVLPDDSTLTESDLLAGLWDHAEFLLFEVNYKSPASGINKLKRGTTGEAKLKKSAWTIEFRSLKQSLQQQVGRVTMKTCSYRLGDEGCKVPLFGSPSVWSFTYVVTTVTSRHSITASAASAMASDFFGNGYVEFLDGPNAGYQAKVQDFAAGVFSLALPLPFTVSPGDAFIAVAGCRLRLIEDCKTKFDNVLNFGGEPHITGPDLLTANPPGT
jgi:uncharacterized phage protein (TIGR02218 family)